MVYAEATVTGVRISERKSGQNDHSIEMQIEQINVEPKVKKDPKNMNPKEYKEYRQMSK